MNLVTVFTAFSPAEAQLVRSRPEAADFHPFVADEPSALSIDGYSLATGASASGFRNLKPPKSANF